MSFFSPPALSRRSLLRLGGAAALAPGWPRTARAGAEPAETVLRAGPARARLAAGVSAQTALWVYNGVTPGPEIRVRQGDRIRVRAENGLAEATTIHWHGVRVPNAMDGVPFLTQEPIAPGGSFLYAFDAVDAGTFWYHPHVRSFEQVGRGLYGPLIIEERDPIRVDRDETWVLDDWRLTPSGEIADDFGNLHDASHFGRVGNTVTLNGRPPQSVAVRIGERIRLRLINAANARIFGLDFGSLEPAVVAIDGQPVTPHAPQGDMLLLAPGMRIDLVIDMTGRPGERIPVEDRFYAGLEYRLLDIVHADEPLRARVPDWPLALPANPLAEPDIAGAIRHEVVFGGGMMGAMGAATQGDMNSAMDPMRSGRIWFVNGVAATGPGMEPVLTLDQGRSYVLAMTNDTALHHPIHLHGHSFRVVARDGMPTRHGEWQDTVLMAPKERIDVAFVADNPGDWMFHCHVLEHQAAGMTSVIRVASAGRKS